MAKRSNLDGEDISNKVVLVLAFLVVLVVVTSTWLVLDKLSGVEIKQPQRRVVQITKVIEQGPPTEEIVGMTTLPRPEEDK